MKRKIFSILLVLVLVCSFSLVMAAPAAAKTLTVSTYGTIQAAINAANPAGGDTIIVETGIYNEDVTIDKSLTLISAEGKDNTIINGLGGEEAAAIRVADGVSNVVIGDTDQGFTINAAGIAAILIVGSGIGNQDITIRDNKLVASGEIATNTRTALSTGGLQSNHTIADNEFSGDANQLVYVNGEASLKNPNRPSMAVNFINNTFSGTATGPALGQEAADSIISGNTFATVTAYASLELWVNNTVTANDFTANLPAGGVYVLDNTGFGPGIPGGGNYVLDIDEVLSNNFFLRAVVVEHSSRLPKIWANIQDAVNASVSGDTVDVAKGTYEIIHSIDILTDELTILGANYDVNPVTNLGERRPESIIKLMACTYAFWIKNADDVTISGFKIDATESGEHHGYFEEGYSSLGVGIGPIGDPPPSADDATVSNNIIVGTSDYAIGCYAANTPSHMISGTVVENNLIQDCKYGFMAGVGLQHAVISGNEIVGSYQTDDEWGAIALWGISMSDITIEGNLIHENALSGIYLGGGNYDSIKVHYNEIRDNSGPGVRVSAGANVVGSWIQFNNIVGNTDYGVLRSGSTVVDATLNWWGSASGPKHALNTYTAPGGEPQGDAVSDNVLYVPWLGAPYPEVAPFAPVTLDEPPGQFSSIQAAINAATGTTITCAAGTYTEAVLIWQKSLTLQGEPGAVIKPDASTLKYDCFKGVGKDSDRRAGIYIYQVDGVIIDGFEIDGTGTDVHYGIIGKYSDGSIVRNCVVHDIKNAIEPPVSDVAGVGIMFYNEAAGAWSGVHNVVIEGNVVYKTGRMGIFLGGWTSEPPYWLLSSNNVIKGNEVYDTWQGPTGGSGGALTILGASGSLIQRNEIYNNTGLNQSGISILGLASDTNRIIQNEIYNNYVGIKVSAGLVKVHYNNIYENAMMGMDNQCADVVDALYNWWGDETGPEQATLNTGAQGNAVSGEVDFSPWLYKMQEEFISGAPCYAGSVVIGKEATSVVVEETKSWKGGWNTFSTPILLDGSADTVGELLALVAGNGLFIERAQRFDLASQKWIKLVMGDSLVGDDYQINPGEGFFIQVSTKGSLPILCNMELFWPQSRELSSGWNLVGAPSYDSKAVEDGLFSLGAATVVNSPGANPVSWSYPPAAGNKLLLPGRAYWVAMSADGTLMCFDGTPVADDLTWQLNK